MHTYYNKKIKNKDLKDYALSKNVSWFRVAKHLDFIPKNFYRLLNDAEIDNDSKVYIMSAIDELVEIDAGFQKVV